MNIFTKALTAMRHTVSRPAMWARLLKRTRFDYRKEVGDCLDASVVTAPCHWVGRALPEATLSIKVKGKDGHEEQMVDHEMLNLVAAPNPFYGDIALWMATVMSFLIDGNAYWIKVRSGAGKPAELWFVPHWMMEPKWPDGDAGTFISHYDYSPGGVEPMQIDAADVVHFRYGINPHNIRKGLSPLDGVIREIFIDLESSNFVASLLRNMGVPGVVISPKGGAMATPDDVDATKSWFKQAFGGDNRGGPLVMGGPTDVQAYGFNPQQLNMSEGRDVSEERVCACIGIPAAIVGFGAGLQSTKVGATMEELRKLAWHNGVLPVLRMFADELQRSLLPDFQRGTPFAAGGAAGQKQTVYWDTDEVLALQEDEDKKTDRWVKRVNGGWATVAEARRASGLDVDDSHDIYLRPISMLEVPVGAAPRPIESEGNAEPAKGYGQKAKSGKRASAEQLKRGRAYDLIMQKQTRGLEAAFKKPLIALFADMGKAAQKAVVAEMGTKSDGDLVDGILGRMGLAAFKSQLRRTMEVGYLEVGKKAAVAGEAAGLGVGLPDPVARAIVAAGGKRVGLIDLEEQTRKAVFDGIAEGRAAGEGPNAIAARIGPMVEAGPLADGQSRAERIARTETKYAQNVSTIERAKAAGVQSFIVFDGRFGLPRSKPDHIARDGSIVTAEEAEIMADEEHPNGTLSFAPNFGPMPEGDDIEEISDAD